MSKTDKGYAPSPRYLAALDCLRKRVGAGLSLDPERVRAFTAELKGAVALRPRVNNNRAIGA
jgi:hypothetical protein